MKVKAMRFFVSMMLAFVLVFAVEVGTHWCIGSHPSLREAYLHEDAQNGKQYLAGYLGLMAPAFLLGVAAGIFGANVRPKVLAGCVVVLAGGVVLLVVVCGQFFPPDKMHWWPWEATNNYERFGGAVNVFLKALSLCGVIAYGSRIFTQHFQQGE